MKRYLLLIPASILVLSGCQMPGVEEVAEEIEGQVDEISGQMESVTEETDDLRDRISALEDQFTSSTGDIQLPDFNTDELVESMNEQFDNLGATTDSLFSAFSQSAHDALSTHRRGNRSRVSLMP